MDEDILRKLVLTPAERQVLLEQADASMVGIESLKDGIRSGGLPGVKQMMTSWTEITQCYEYMSNMLSAKTQRAVALLVAEKGAEDGD